MFCNNVAFNLQMFMTSLHFAHCLALAYKLPIFPLNLVVQVFWWKPVSGDYSKLEYFKNYCTQLGGGGGQIDWFIGMGGWLGLAFVGAYTKYHVLHSALFINPLGDGPCKYRSIWDDDVHASEAMCLWPKFADIGPTSLYINSQYISNLSASMAHHWTNMFYYLSD